MLSWWTLPWLFCCITPQVFSLRSVTLRHLKYFVSPSVLPSCHILCCMRFNSHALSWYCTCVIHHYSIILMSAKWVENSFSFVVSASGTIYILYRPYQGAITSRYLSKCKHPSYIRRSSSAGRVLDHWRRPWQDLGRVLLSAKCVNGLQSKSEPPKVS